MPPFRPGVLEDDMRLALTLTLYAGAAAADSLTVYVPDYFGSEWGPTPAIKAAFEETCDCEIEFVAGEVLTRLRLEGERTEADVVLGLNTDVAAEARELDLFAPHRLDTTDLTLPIDWTDETFLPFNWGYTAFVYDTDVISNAPGSFAELLEMDDDIRIVIQDPRSSISGLALAYWVDAVFGDGATEAWTQLEPKILTVTKGWSESYGLFTSGEADMVLSYTTSPAYHISAEGDETKVAAIFEEGHYFMAEVAAKVAGTDQPELADQFMAFILTPAFQEIIPEGNWSYPAKLPRDQWPEVFRNLPEPSTALFYTEQEAAERRDDVIETWRSALTQ
ncbi:thiamine ABC transporter substrate binding subunit [Aestuariibius insulae]|uniref:thiamine ABC transporter substrate-binding protein n=1 Tax=Aestuariibius insulae TaxID=2058287 RepID=UPI00398E72CF